MTLAISIERVVLAFELPTGVRISSAERNANVRPAQTDR
jgi:hypothetical protein